MPLGYVADNGVVRSTRTRKPSIRLQRREDTGAKLGNNKRTRKRQKVAVKERNKRRPSSHYVPKENEDVLSWVTAHLASLTGTCVEDDQGNFSSDTARRCPSSSGILSSEPASAVPSAPFPRPAVALSAATPPASTAIAPVAEPATAAPVLPAEPTPVPAPAAAVASDCAPAPAFGVASACHADDAVPVEDRVGDAAPPSLKLLPPELAFPFTDADLLTASRAMRDAVEAAVWDSICAVCGQYRQASEMMPAGEPRPSSPFALTRPVSPPRGGSSLLRQTFKTWA